MQALDAVHEGIIAAMVARAVNGLDGACNAIGGGGCPVVAIGGCPGQSAGIVRGCPAMAPVAYGLLLTPGRLRSSDSMLWTLPRAAPGQMKSPRTLPRAIVIRRLYDRAGRVYRRVYIALCPRVYSAGNYKDR